jgi:hypothetical protein
VAATELACAGRDDQPTHNAIIVLAETNQLFTGTGRMFGYTGIAIGTTFRVQVYDHATATTNLVFDKTVVAIGEVLVVDIPFQNGMRVVTTGTPGQINLQYSKL